jgi:phage terminase Nu1 subunit (DNA packaging protein)
MKSEFEPVSSVVLAEMLGVNPRHLSNLEKSGAVYKLDRGMYDLRKSVRGMCQYLRDQKQKTEETGYEVDKARKMSADADLAEIEAGKAAGKLVETRVIRRRWESAVIACRTKLLTIPDRTAPKVIVASSLDAAKKILNEEICDALESLTEVKHEPDEQEHETEANETKD